ncbi:hypothetical protein KY290_036136 [Solanum tuberosum]|uniref:Transposon MuDR mudrA n=1 Tax=Solanum tuberosum TaxID=4113 RepID=A0ABQ7TTG8_SOLTU|nr:hypothetical protein KY290_036136 [Solanum tuberosum]
MEEIIFTKIYHGGILSEMNPLLDTAGPTCYLTNDSIDVGKVVDLSGEGEVVNLGGESIDVNLGEEGEVVNLGGEDEDVNLGGEDADVNLGGEGEHVNLGGKGVDDDNLRGEGVDDNLGGEGEFDFLSSDSDLGDMPSENGSDIDEDDDSDEQLDVDVVRGVDIPARRRSKKVRYDEDCEVSIFELKMIFEGANQFRKAVADYVVEYMNQINQLLPLSGHKRPYSSASFVAATGGNRRLATDFGVYFDPTTGAQIFNPGTSSEKIPHGPTKLKSASPINIYIDFKPRGLKWKGKDAVSTSQLQQMKANRKNKGSCGTSKK